MQGESDRGKPGDYELAFRFFVKDIRDDISEIMGEDLSDLPVIVGEISRTSGSAYEDNVKTNESFISMQRLLPNRIKNVYVVASGQYEINWLENGNNKNGQDGWHWTTEPMFRIGELVGKCIVDNILT